MTAQLVVESTDADFARDVIDRSEEVAVVVDFWAPWCEPCRILGPILEQVAAEHGDAVQLVKINTDENPGVASQFQIQGIPAVIAFRDRAPVSQFVGALPEPQVREFFSQLVPSAADADASEAQQLLAAGDRDAARARFEAVLQGDGAHEAASLGLAAILAEDGDWDRVASLVAPWPNDPVSRRLLGLRRFHDAADGADKADLTRRLAADENDADAHYRLGNLLAVEGVWEAALEHLLQSVRLDRSVDEDGARLRLLDAFAILGDDSELTIDYRRRLGSVLF